VRPRPCRRSRRPWRSSAVSCVPSSRQASVPPASWIAVSRTVTPASSIRWANGPLCKCSQPSPTTVTPPRWDSGRCSGGSARSVRGRNRSGHSRGRGACRLPRLSRRRCAGRRCANRSPTARRDVVPTPTPPSGRRYASGVASSESVAPSDRDSPDPGRDIRPPPPRPRRRRHARAGSRRCACGPTHPVRWTRSPGR